MDTNSTPDPLQLLHSRGLRATSSRTQVLEMIARQSSAVPYSTLQDELSELDRVTLYRTLQTLVTHGLIHKAVIDHDQTYYALCPQQCSSSRHAHEHLHFLCTLCETVTCVELPQALDIELPGYTIDTLELEVSGVCPSCQKI